MSVEHDHLRDRRAANRARQKRWYDRRCVGVAVYDVEIDPFVFDALVRARWLTEAELTDRGRVSEMLRVLVRDGAVLLMENAEKSS